MDAYDHLPPKMRHALAYNNNGGLSPYKILQDLMGGVPLAALIRVVTQQYGRVIKEPKPKPNKATRRRQFHADVIKRRPRKS